MFFAADQGHVEVIKLLLDRGADVNALDTLLQIPAADDGGDEQPHAAAVSLLLERGSEGAGVTRWPMGAATGNNVPLVTAALEAKGLTAADMQGGARGRRNASQNAEIIAAHRKADRRAARGGGAAGRNHLPGGAEVVRGDRTATTTRRCW